MAHHPLLLRFIDDELDRAGLLAQELVATVQERVRVPQGGQAPHERQFGVELQQALASQSPAVVRRFVESLREQVMAGLAESAAASGAAGPSPQRSRAPTLALVDEAEVAAEVELSRAVEAIASVAEHELRELRAFTSALSGDVRLARETNPFRADVYARALWAGAQVLPLSRGFQVAFMRHAAMPLAQALRLAYAAACTRLEDEGVEPASYSTIILPAGQRTARPTEEDVGPVTDLAELRDSMPSTLDIELPTRDTLDDVLQQADDMLRLPDSTALEARMQALEQQRVRFLDSASSRLEQQLVELFGRLFDAVLGDHTLPAITRTLLSRLHAAALRVAIRDAAMLDDHGHPVWQFIDRVAFLTSSELVDGTQQERARRLAHSLIDDMAREPVQDAALFSWGLERLGAVERHHFERRCADATAEIASLAELEGHITGLGRSAAAAGMAIDVGALDTVPAELIDLHRADADADAAQAARWLQQRRPGDRLRLLLRGRWVAAQVLWHSDLGEVWLLAELPDGEHWALRRGALERLRSEGLVQPLRLRSLVEHAAEAVLEGIAAG